MATPTRLSTKLNKQVQSFEEPSEDTQLWQEEHLTRDRDLGKVMLKLQKENAALRTQLKELSMKLNGFLEKLYPTAKATSTPKLAPRKSGVAQFEIHNKRLASYQQEHKRLSTRKAELDNSEFEYQLLEQITAKESRLKELEKLQFALTKQSSNLASSLIAMPEASLDASEFLRVTKEHKRYTTLVDRVAAENALNVERKLKMQEKLQVLEQKFQQQMQRMPKERPDRTEEIKSSILEASLVIARTERVGKSKATQLTLEIKQCERHLRDLEMYRQMLADKLLLKTAELGSCQTELKQKSQRRVRARPESEGLSPFIT